MRFATRLTALALVAVPVFSTHPVYAEGIHATGAIPGYKCMSLNVTEEDLMDPTAEVPIRASPSDKASVVGRASSIVFSSSPPVEVSGFVKILRFDGGPGWIDARYIVPWHTPDYQPGSCAPVYTSNGHIGPLVK